MLKQRTIVLALAMLMIAPLSACGRKGALFMERPAPAAAVQPAAQPATAQPDAPVTPSTQPASGK